MDKWHLNCEHERLAEHDWEGCDGGKLCPNGDCIVCDKKRVYDMIARLRQALEEIASQWECTEQDGHESNDGKPCPVCLAHRALHPEEE